MFLSRVFKTQILGNTCVLSEIFSKCWAIGLFPNGVLGAEKKCIHPPAADVYTFSGTDQCQLPDYGLYSYKCKSI